MLLHYLWQWSYAPTSALDTDCSLTEHFLIVPLLHMFEHITLLQVLGCPHNLLLLLLLKLLTALDVQGYQVRGLSGLLLNLLLLRVIVRDLHRVLRVQRSLVRVWAVD